MRISLILREIAKRLESLGFPEPLQDGCTELMLQSLEMKVGIPLHPSHREALLFADGEASENPAFGMLGFDCRYLSCAGVDSAVQRIRDASAFFGDVDLAPDGPVKASYWNPRWIPFIASPYVGFFVDMDPAQGGNLGQVINANVEEGFVRVIAPHIEGFLGQIVVGIDSRKYRIDDQGFWVFDP